jgi:hypothetical protein
MLAKQFQSARGQGNIAILGAFAVVDVEYHPGTIDLLDLKLSPFLESQTAGVDGRETDSVAWDLDQAEKLVNLLDAENGRKLFLAGRANEVQGRQVLVESMLEEELDAA